MLKLLVKEIEKTVKDIQAEEDRTRKAAETAVKVESFRLAGLLKQEMKQGMAGGAKFSPLSEIAKRLGRGRNREPLSRLSVAVRYSTERQAIGIVGYVGFVDAGRKKLSKSWQRIARFQQEGGRVPVTEERRRAIRSIGESLRKKRIRWIAGGRSGGYVGTDPDSESRYFFLRKTTTAFRVPARPIIDPFIAMHRMQAETNIVKNFERKMRGERI